jgi:hypothetical protein
MASRNSSRSTTSHTSQEGSDALDPQAAAETARQQLGALAQAADMMLRSAEIWQQAQLQLTQRTRSSYREAATRLSQANSPAELLSIQSDLLVSGWHQAMQFSVDLMTAAAAQQAEARAATQERQNPVGLGLNAMAPMVQAWQSMFTSPLNGASQTTH